MNEEIALLINSLPDNVKNLLITMNGDKMQINGNNFARAMQACSDIKDEEKVVEIFLRTLVQNQWKNIDWNKVEPIKDILIRICREAGLKESENPFIVLLGKLLESATLTRDNLIDLNNLYANDELSYEDIAGKGKEGTQHIIYNPNLYDSDDVYEVVQIWNWLGEPRNLNKMNWNEVLNANISNRVNEVASQLQQMETDDVNISDEDARYYRNRLMYDDNNRLNSLYSLKELLKRGSISSDGKTSTENTARTQNSRAVDFEQEFKNLLRNTNLTDQEIKDAVAKAYRDYRIN